MKLQQTSISTVFRQVSRKELNYLRRHSQPVDIYLEKEDLESSSLLRGVSKHLDSHADILDQIYHLNHRWSSWPWVARWFLNPQKRIHQLFIQSAEIENQFFAIFTAKKVWSEGLKSSACSALSSFHASISNSGTQESPWVDWHEFKTFGPFKRNRILLEQLNSRLVVWHAIASKLDIAIAKTSESRQIRSPRLTASPISPWKTFNRGQIDKQLLELNHRFKEKLSEAIPMLNSKK